MGTVDRNRHAAARACVLMLVVTATSACYSLTSFNPHFHRPGTPRGYDQRWSEDLTVCEARAGAAAQGGGSWSRLDVRDQCLFGRGWVVIAEFPMEWKRNLFASYGPSQSDVYLQLQREFMDDFETCRFIADAKPVARQVDVMRACLVDRGWPQVSGESSRYTAESLRVNNDGSCRWESDVKRCKSQPMRLSDCLTDQGWALWIVVPG